MPQLRFSYRAATRTCATLYSGKSTVSEPPLTSMLDTTGVTACGASSVLAAHGTFAESSQNSALLAGLKFCTSMLTRTLPAIPRFTREISSALIGRNGRQS